MCIGSASALLAAAIAASAAPAKQVIVVCSPGSPGTTEDAQPTLDAFAAAVSAKAGIALAAVYDPTEPGGVARIKDAGLAIVSLPFLLAHEQALGLHPRLDAIQKGRPALERWVLVARKDRVKRADALAGFTIVSSAAFAPAFVRGVVLGTFGKLPANTKLVQSSAVLSALRRAANGDPVAVVLDGPQAASLSTLPFGDRLEVVARSPELPAGIVVTVGDRMPAKTWSGIEAALLGLARDRAAVEALAAIQIDRFAPLDDKALDQARKAYASAS